MEKPIASVKFRLPIPVIITLSIGFGLLFFYLITVALSFVFQDAIESSIGINPAKISIIILMLVLVIPWAVLAWGILQKYAKIGTVHLYADHLTLVNAEQQLIKNYPAQDITLIKIQNAAAHFEFRDGYRFNILNLGMDKGYANELYLFNQQLQKFINANNITAQRGRII